MKKLVFAIAVAMIASLFYSPVMASDFTAGGSYRALAHFEDPGADEESKYFDQRFRVKFNWAVNDNVSATLRGDFAEMTWGDDYRPDAGGDDRLMIDQAFVTINQGPMTLKVGQMPFNLTAPGTLWSYQFQGVVTNFDLDDFGLDLAYSKQSEGGDATAAVAADADPGTPAGNVATDDGANDDTDVYGVGLTYANDAFSGGIGFATLRDDADDSEKTGYSIYATLPLTMVTLSGAVDMFDGDVGDGSDYAGSQAHVAADFDVTEQFIFGVTGLWADDVDDDETQLTAVQDDAYFSAFDFAGALAVDNGGYGGYTGIFDVSGASAGVMGIAADAQFAATDALTLYAKLGYAEPEGDVTLDNKVYAIGNFDYAWMEAVTLSAGAAYVKPDNEDTTNDDALVEYHLRLGVGF